MSNERRANSTRFEGNVERYLVATAAAVHTIGNLIGVKIDIGMWAKKPQNDGTLPGVSAANWNSCRNYGKLTFFRGNWRQGERSDRNGHDKNENGI